MGKKNCTICGTHLFVIKDGEWFCPNHGVIVENQDWNDLEVRNVKKNGDKMNKEKQSDD